MSKATRHILHLRTQQNMQSVSGLRTKPNFHTHNLKKSYQDIRAQILRECSEINEETLNSLQDNACQIIRQSPTPTLETVKEKIKENTNNVLKNLYTTFPPTTNNIFSQCIKAIKLYNALNSFQALSCDLVPNSTSLHVSSELHSKNRPLRSLNFLSSKINEIPDRRKHKGKFHQNINLLFKKLSYNGQHAITFCKIANIIDHLSKNPQKQDGTTDLNWKQFYPYDTSPSKAIKKIVKNLNEDIKALTAPDQPEEQLAIPPLLPRSIMPLPCSIIPHNQAKLTIPPPLNPNSIWHCTSEELARLSAHRGLT